MDAPGGKAETRRARFRIVPGKRVVDPRTQLEDGKAPVQGKREKYVPNVIDPFSAAALYHAEPWLSAGLDAIATGVKTAEVSPVYRPADKTLKADAKKTEAMRAFLEEDERAFSTPNERLGALALDYKMLGYCAFEVGRGSDRKPKAWYHVPAATLRKLANGKGYDQVDRSGKVLQRFAPYKPGGAALPEGTAELVWIERYDPTATYTGSPVGVPLINTLDRLGAQDELNTKILRKGGMPPWLLVIREALDDDDYERMKAWFAALEAGESGEMVGILDGVGEGADLKKLIEDMADMSFGEAEKAMRDRILAKLRVPPTKVSLSASNYATAQQEDATFKFGVCQPLLACLLRRLTVVAREIVEDPAYAFGFSQQTLEDYLQVCQAEEILMRGAAHTINEALARLGQPGIGPMGDVRIAFTNQGPVLLEDLAAGNVPPTPGRLVDVLLQLRRTIEQAQDEGHEHALQK